MVDVVEGEGERGIEFWHAGEPVTELAPGRWRIGECAELTADAEAQCEVVEGWRSDVLGSKRPAPVIRVRVRGACAGALASACQAVSI